MARPAPVAERLSTYIVEVLEGPDQGKRYDLDASHPARVLIGQSPLCEVCLHDRQVSRRHVALELETGGVRLSDLDSTNGTTVNGVQVTQALLKGEEIIRVGGTVIRLCRTDVSHHAQRSNEQAFGRLIGGSLAMQRLYPLLQRLAKSSVAVLIEGETGTGKELLAESLHEQGPRAKAPFVVFDCSSTPAHLVESALFGQEQGAYGGSGAPRGGLLEQADGGSLFIDEIADLDLAVQPKLLRVLERGQFRRVGGERLHTVDVRILAATSRDLEREIQEGRFRDDLFYRLAVARIELPPLRRRKGELPLLARHFWKELGGERQMPSSLLHRLESYDWPGNVRELRNHIARHLALGELAEVGFATREPSEPPPSASAAGGDWLDRIIAERLPLARARQRVLDEFLNRYVSAVLADHGGNVSRAAAASGIARRYFQIIRARLSNPPGPERGG